MRHRLAVMTVLGALTVAAGGSLFPARMVAQAPDPSSAPAGGGGRQRGGGQGGGQFAGMQRGGGEVTAVDGANITVKTPEGATMVVVTTANTRVMKTDRTAGKVADVKVGDGVIAMGNLDESTKSIHAAMLMVTDAATVKKLKDDMGKTYITGKVTAIDLDNAKMTVLRTDGVSQTITFDDSSSFKRGRPGRGGAGGGMMGMGGMGGGAEAAAPPAGADAGESITLADVKVGDTVTAPGSVKAGVFVPAAMTVTTPRPRREGAPGAPAAGADTGSAPK